MGPVEIVFIVVILLFGAIGIVRGYQRELGVTAMLLIALFVLTFIEATFSDQVLALLGKVGVDEASADSVWALIATGFLLIIAFISYQGIVLLFPGSGRNWFLSGLIGLTIGYLLAGSIWYYLAQADWPFGKVVPDYSQFYDLAVQLLPPAILTWQYFIGLAVLMLILRVVK
jgi:hypothetical protein